jgi:hypothetical protein
MSDQPITIGDNTAIRDDKGRWLPGIPPQNPTGRPPKSISLKDEIRKYLETHPHDVQEIVGHFVKNNRELMWQMLEGRPQQQTEVNIDEESVADLTKFFKSLAAKPDEPIDGSGPEGL